MPTDTTSPYALLELIELETVEQTDVEDDFELDDEDYIAGWGLPKAQILASEDYSDSYSTFDADDYEYLQGGY